MEEDLMKHEYEKHPHGEQPESNDDNSRSPEPFVHQLRCLNAWLMGPTPGRGRSRLDTANQSNAWRRSQGGVVTVGVIRATWAGWPVTSDPGLKVSRDV
ncbi:unnamed protein product [Boreogadus saida]